MQLPEKIAGLVGGFGILLTLLGLALYRFFVVGVDIVSLPATATPWPTANLGLVAVLPNTPVPTFEPTATYLPTTTSEPTATPLPQATSGPVVVLGGGPVVGSVVHVVARGENLYRIALSY